MENLDPKMEENISSKETNNNKTEKPVPIIVKKPGGWKIVLSSIILAIIFSIIFGATAGFIFGGLGSAFSSKITGFMGRNNIGWKAGNISSDSIRQKLIDEDTAVIDVVSKSSPAVVSIVISKDVSKLQDSYSNFFGFDDFFDDFFGNGNSSESQDENNESGNEKTKIGSGTGFLITSDGMIVTNKHVISDENAEYSVITNDGKEYPAKVLAKDQVNDIAVIKISGADFPVLNFGNSDSLKIGQTVIAIGNSLGEFSNTVSKGIISGLKRSVTAGSKFGETERLNNIIQTDAAINPGNSGGPLLNVNGEVIGINVAMAQGAQSIGFAIPSSQIEKIINQVKTTGKISTPYLGVRYIPVTTAIQKSINLPYNYGVLVVRGNRVTDFAVIPGSPADKAGIVENDLILEINGDKIDSKNGLLELISKYNVGEELTLKVWHKGDLKDIKVKLEERR